MEAAQAHLSLHLSKCQIVGNHMSRFIYFDQILHSYTFFESGREYDKENIF